LSNTISRANAGQTTEELGGLRVLPPEVEMAHRTGHEHDVAVAFPERLIGNANIAALGIACLGPTGYCPAVWHRGAVVETRLLT
jgi:hypothetical protein